MKNSKYSLPYLVVKYSTGPQISNSMYLNLDLSSDYSTVLHFSSEYSTGYITKYSTVTQVLAGYSTGYLSIPEGYSTGFHVEQYSTLQYKNLPHKSVGKLRLISVHYLKPVQYDVVQYFNPVQYKPVQYNYSVQYKNCTVQYSPVQYTNLMQQKLYLLIRVSKVKYLLVLD